MQKKMLTLLACLWICLSSIGQSPSEAVVFREKTHDFGTVYEEKGKVSHIYFFTNTSRKAVVITGVSTTCRCLTGEFSREPVKPGETGSVTLILDPQYIAGDFSREAIILSDGGESYSRLHAKGTVIPSVKPVSDDHPYYFGEGIHLSLKVVIFGNLGLGQSKEVLMRYANENDFPVELTFGAEPADKNLTFANPGRLEAGERGQMVFRYAMNDFREGGITIKVYPAIDGKRLKEPLTVKVTGISHKP